MLWDEDGIEEGFLALRLAVITSVEEQRKKDSLCPECGEGGHDGCLLAEGPLITADEFLDHAAYLIAATVEVRS